MRFVVYSRLQAIRMDLREPHAVISIHDPGSEPPAIPESAFLRGVLRLSFHDLDRAGGREDAVLFTPGHAHEILDFLGRVRGEVEALVVHCEAGISRSAGVAAALSRALFDADRFFFEHYVPNPLVYATLLRVWGERALSGR
jgi:predicted protein tyrosine phosphatase